MENFPNQPLPTRMRATIFRAKATILQTKRCAENLFDKNLERFSFQSELQDQPVVAESQTILWTEKDAREKFLLAGKIHNLRLAVKKLNGLEIPAERTFSFWKHIGKTNRRNGYVAGRELREGCIIPNVGGGLCQLSNALYDAALKANFTIIERRAHTQIVAGSLAEQGRDATVFWNYVDLRFKSANAFRIEAKLDAKRLIVRFKSSRKNTKQVFQISKTAASGANDSNHPGSCATCGVEDCFRVVKPARETSDFGRAAFLLDEFSPEFDEYVQAKRNSKDFLFVPLDGQRFKKASYAWTTKNFAKTKQSFFVAALRSYKSRKLAAQGAARQNNLLAMSEKLAESYAKSLSFDVLHIVVQQNLLPFLWREGVLGGRTFDVLMTSLPIKDLQERLDYAKSLHPESKTLGDFRAPQWLVEAETEALKTARKVITTHTEIASLFPRQKELLNWHLPKTHENQRPKIKDQTPTIVFPASTIGRKGVYELREAVRGLDLKIMILGANVECDDFWNGIETTKDSGGKDWLRDADLIVLPAFVEHKPRRLLQAVAAKIPVIASTACGLENIAGVESFAAGNAEDLREKILEMLFAGESFQKNIIHVEKSSLMFSK